LASKEAMRTVNLNLIKALAHPSRVHALHILNQRAASPTELAPEVGTSVSRMAYHIRELEKFGCVELVRTTPRRGAIEHFYRALERASFSDGEWAQIPRSIRKGIVSMELRTTGKLLSDSLEAGNFEHRTNRHQSLFEEVVDEQAWDESMALLSETMEKLIEIQVASNERRIGDEAPGIPMAISLIGFETTGKPRPGPKA
jgi:DNA-binding transcriptional regulator GbsR (MarR family)